MEIRIVVTVDRDLRRTVEVVDEAGRTTGGLCMGEVIEQVLGLVYPGENKLYTMMTPAEWDARWKAAQQRRKAILSNEESDK